MSSGAIREILGDISDQDTSKLELEDSLEVELEGEFFYTLIDMEDGNYIAIDKRGKVFRLHHDSYEQAKEIYPSVDEFLKVYNGDKETMVDLFD